MNNFDQKKAAELFVARWNEKKTEKQYNQLFWIDLLRSVYEVTDATSYIQFERRITVKHNGKKRVRFIDAFIPSKRVLIEQKGANYNLDEPELRNGEWITPEEQARRYNEWLSADLKAKWIIICNFETFRVYDLYKPTDPPVEFKLEELPKKLHVLDMLIDDTVARIKVEEEVSVAAGELVGKLYKSLQNQYANPESRESKHSLNVLMVRLVFCLYAEDAGLFSEHDSFGKFIQSYKFENLQSGLRELFDILDTPEIERDPDTPPKMLAFPYVNGGLFDSSQKVRIPVFSEEAYNILLHDCSEDFDWSVINATIFGALFESTLNDELRRSGGMHYTSIDNIHKIIDPLFLKDLRGELDRCKAYKIKAVRDRELNKLQTKLASLRFMDPACGSGNFLTETFYCLRQIENEIINLLQKGNAVLGDLGESVNPIKVSVSQFYGIEINDFATSVAKTALWIVECKALLETQSIVNAKFDFLPLKSNVNIHTENALRIDWNDVCSSQSLNYIMGNPPFVGLALRNNEQQKDMALVFTNNKRAGRLDYVAAWYKKAVEYMKDTYIEAAFVSTNSITQGEQVSVLWPDLIANHNFQINFAHRSFKWESETKDKAAVTVIIIGFSVMDVCKQKYIIDKKVLIKANHINGYLIDADDIVIPSRSKPKNSMPQLKQGSKPWDGGHLLLNEQEKSALESKYPKAKSFIKLYIGAEELLSNKKRYCLWLKDVPINEFSTIPEIKERLLNVAEIRKKTKTKAVNEQANTPMLFSQDRQPTADYLCIPEISSETRKYIPMKFVKKDVIASNRVMTMENASLYIFGILQSSLHMYWTKTICGRLEMRFCYTPSIYNNFPFPNPTIEQKQKIENTAQAIINVREKYANYSLTDLYNNLKEEDSDKDNILVKARQELLEAHSANDCAVLEAYGMLGKVHSESECVAWLFRMYQDSIKQ